MKYLYIVFSVVISIAAGILVYKLFDEQETPQRKHRPPKRPKHKSRELNTPDPGRNLQPEPKPPEDTQQEKEHIKPRVIIDLRPERKKPKKKPQENTLGI